MTAAMSPEDALVAVMIAVSAADAELSDDELLSITRMIDALPIFQNYDRGRISAVTRIVFDLFEDEDGIDALVGLVRDSLPPGLEETAYALACDVAAADGHVDMTELRLLEILRHDLDVDRLTSAAIELGARARHRLLP